MKSRRWTDTELETMRQLYPTTRTSDLAAMFRRPASQVYQTAQRLGLHKTEAYLNDPATGARMAKGTQPPGGLATRFKPGVAPHNKGVKRPGWFSGRMKDGWFQKGQLAGMAAKNYNPIGTVKPDTYGYLRIKVRDAVHGKEATGFGNLRVWPLLQRHVWEQNNGPIPPGMTICFRDGDRSNCDISNLEMVSRRELARRNSMWTNYPKELAQVIQLAGALRRRLKGKERGKEHD